jgi:hypothetical protein
LLKGRLAKEERKGRKQTSIEEATGDPAKPRSWQFTNSSFLIPRPTT